MRNHSIDTLKFVCAILIVLLHTSTSYSYLYIPLTRCAVPVFFMISGYMLYGEEMPKRLKRGIWKILKIIVWSTLLYAVFLLILSKGDLQSVIPTKTQLRDMFLFNVNPWWGTFMVFKCIFVCNVDNYTIFQKKCLAMAVLAYCTAIKY